MHNIPLSLYIHIPWCIRKCPYCDFNSHKADLVIPEKQYIKTLLQDLYTDLPFIKNREIHSIFFGGGTPSLFSSEGFYALLQALQTCLPFKKNLEITLEANPGTFEQARFTEYRQAGINRLSIGIQSFNPEKLKALGRIHDHEEALAAIATAKNAGFDNINLDLMYGLPSQTLEDAMQDLETAIACRTQHLSWYHLTLEPNTLFYKNPPPLPEDDIAAQIQLAGQALLKKHAYLHYEVSAYSLEGFTSQHNMNYWEFGDYLGIGAGAHSKITDLETGTAYRQWKIKHPKFYMAATQHTGNKHAIMKQDLAFEFMLNALRLQKPIPIALFQARTHLNLTDIACSLKQAQKQNLLNITDDHFVVTPLGKQFLNDLMALFLPNKEI